MCHATSTPSQRGTATRGRSRNESDRRSHCRRARGASRSWGRKNIESGPRTATSASATPRSAMRTCCSMCADWRYSSAIASSGDTIPSTTIATPARKIGHRVHGASSGRRACKRRQPCAKNPTATAAPTRTSGSSDHAFQRSSVAVAASGLTTSYGSPPPWGCSRGCNEVVAAAKPPPSGVCPAGGGDQAAGIRSRGFPLRATGPRAESLRGRPGRGRARGRGCGRAGRARAPRRT